MSVVITSTTDSPEVVSSAMGLAKSAKNEGKEEKSAPEAKEASEQKEATESDTEASEEKEEADDSSDSESEEGEKSDDSEKEKPKKKGGFQRRIDKLSSQKAEAQREVEYWRNLAMNGTEAKNQKTPNVEAPKNLQGKPNPDNFETHTEFVEALTDWKTDQKLAARDQELSKSKLQNEQDQVMKAHSDRVKSFTESKNDFMDVLVEVDDIVPSPTVQEVIVSSENGPALMYELAKNREEYERICKLSPLAAARELGKIEARLSSDKETPKESNKITKAPKPLNPVTAKSSTAGKPLEEMDYQEYKKARELQLRKRA